MSGEVDLAEGAFPDETPETIVSYISQFLRREFSVYSITRQPSTIKETSCGDTV